MEYNQKALDIWTKAYGMEQSNIATSSYNNIPVMSTLFQGDYAHAMEYFKKALGIITNEFGEEHPYVVS